ncbi:hypothetical protein N865_11140 [Intrasporangium oryzae NRRL B-24470]|uniref:Uncharacterized protein n=1 Tax=Intrasporangium oryzae NRRL B-24470 TaxID=1386089 RepID=W9G7F5_9MICO|nr:hypothetical protein [Intrasporangium oryzae]EWT01212.1 hypothetical protein N865_11140 [Intrasporangium oryzae NRRL B-24470]
MPHQSRLEMLRCRECGERRCIESSGQPPRCLPPGDGSGFVIEHVEVTVLGRCPSCVARRAGDHVPEAG